MMKQRLFSTIFLLQFCMFFAFSNNIITKKNNYINRYKDIAIEEMRRSSIPASITLAQGILESGWGDGNLAKQSNNHFGIKCKENWTGRSVPYKDDDRDKNGNIIESCFRAYSSPEESYRDHTDFLLTRGLYDELFKLHPMDYVGWAKGLKKCKYATADDYAERLIGIIEENQLYKYDNQLFGSYDNEFVTEFSKPQSLVIPSPNTNVRELEIEDENEEYLDIIIPGKTKTQRKTQRIYTQIHTSTQSPKPTDYPSINHREEENIANISKPVIGIPTVRKHQINTNTMVAPRFQIPTQQKTNIEIPVSDEAPKPQINIEIKPNHQPDAQQAPLSTKPNRGLRGEQTKRGISLDRFKLR